MKHLLFILMLAFSFNLHAQGDLTGTAPTTAPSSKFSNLVNKFTVTATLGTGYYHDHTSQLNRLSLGELSVQYKSNSRLSFGLGFKIGILDNLVGSAIHQNTTIMQDVCPVNDF